MLLCIAMSTFVVRKPGELSVPLSLSIDRCENSRVVYCLKNAGNASPNIPVGYL